MAWYDDIGNGIKSAWDGVTGYVKFCGENIKDGWTTVGDFYSMAGDDFKNGAWVGGIGNGLMGTLSILGATGNTLLGGNLKAAGDALFDNTVDFSYEDGTAHLTAKEDNNFLGNMFAATAGKFVETGVNAELEMDEAIQEGDIDKANKMGGIILVEGVSIPVTAVALVAGGEALAGVGTIGAAASAGGASAVAAGATVAGTGVASAGLNMANDRNHMVMMIETPDDYYSDTADGFVQKMVDAGYIDANDEASIAEYKRLTEIHLSGVAGASDEAVYKSLLVNAQNNGDLNIAKDYFADTYRKDANFKVEIDNNLKASGIDVNTLSEDQKTGIYEKYYDTYASYDVNEITLEDLQRNLTVANNTLVYTLNDPNMSQEMAEFYANLDVDLALGEISQNEYFSQAISKSLEDTGMTKAQIDAYTDYMVDVNLGEITQQEAVDLMAKDPDLSNLFDQDGNLVIPAKEEAQAQVSETLTKPSGMPEADWVKYKAYLESQKEKDGQSSVTNNSVIEEKEVNETGNTKANVESPSETTNASNVPAGAVEIINSDWSSKYGDKFEAIINTVNATLMKYAPDTAEKLMGIEADFFKSHDLQFSVAEKDVAELSKDDIVAALKDDAQDILDTKEPVTEAPSVTDQGLAFE